jgi:hypothetical protein
MNRPKTRSNKSESTTRSDSTNRRSGSKSSSSSQSTSTAGFAEPLPWFSSKNPEKPKDDKACLVFLAELWAFLLEAQRRGLVDDKLHPDVERFLNEYGLVLMFAVNNSADRLSQNQGMWEELKKNGTLIFPGRSCFFKFSPIFKGSDGIAEMMNLCLSQLTLRMKNMKAKRTKEQQIFDEVFACTLMAILQVFSLKNDFF